jgi:hypothetical protein
VPAVFGEFFDVKSCHGYEIGGCVMRLGLINSAWAQAGRDTAWGIRKTQEIGFDSIDIFADPLDIDVRERALIRRECSAAGLPIVSVCCVATGLIDFIWNAAVGILSFVMSCRQRTCCWCWGNTSGIRK